MACDKIHANPNIFRVTAQLKVHKGRYSVPVASGKTDKRVFKNKSSGQGAVLDDIHIVDRKVNAFQSTGI